MSFSQISIKELPTWIKVLKKDPETSSPEDMLAELELYDRLLIIQKSASLLNRKRGLKAQLDACIGQSLGHKRGDLTKRTR